MLLHSVGTGYAGALGDGVRRGADRIAHREKRQAMGMNPKGKGKTEDRKPRAVDSETMASPGGGLTYPTAQTEDNAPPRREP
jgi:hypothetical protein